MKWTLLLVPLLIGCGQPEEVTQPEPVEVEQFGLTLHVCPEEPLRDMGLEPVIIIPKPDDWMLWLILKDRMEHCEQFGLGIDDGMGPSPPGPDSSGADQ